jgi:GMP synthase (glutamine-hydrolysing)
VGAAAAAALCEGDTMTASKRILIVRTGRPSEPVARRFGGFEDWFGRLVSPRVDVEVADAAAPLPAFSPFDGILLTGSLASVTERAPWMHALAHWSLAAARARPLLGVCFGHQLLGWALGGRVERNPSGPECGTRTVTLTAAGRADPLFDGLPPRFLAPEAHEDHVRAAPPGARLLATGARTPVEAFAWGDTLRAVQFHPEFDEGRSHATVSASRAMLNLARPGGCSIAHGTIRATPVAAQVLDNWLTGFVGAPSREA